MIDINDIINSASLLLKDKDNMLILHKSISISPIVKAYKLFSYKLYLVNNKTNQKSILLDKSFSLKIPNEDLEEGWKDCDKKYLQVLIKWLTSKEFTIWI